MCRLYKDNTAFSLDDLRVKSFLTTNRQEEVPPTSDAAKHHICRAFLQANIWYQANIPRQNIMSNSVLYEGITLSGE